MSQLPTTTVSTSMSGAEPSCDDSVECCQSAAATSAIPEKMDGAGEPCPAPLVWQEVREAYLRDSMPWELVRESRRLTGQTWGSGRPLYFLNNFAGTAELFCLAAWLLKDQFRCVMFDTVIDQPRKAAPPTMADFCSDLFAIADEHGDEQLLVYGAAFGAAIGLQAAIDRPDRIGKLILQHGFASRRLSWTERLLASFCLRSPLSLSQLPQRRRFQAVNHKPWFPPFDDSRFEFLLESTGNLKLSDLALRAFAVHRFSVESRLSEVRLPVLLLRTEGEGRVAAEAQQSLEKQMTGARVEWMHSAGQHPYLTHPHRVAKLIKSFSES